MFRRAGGDVGLSQGRDGQVSNCRSPDLSTSHPLAADGVGVGEAWLSVSPPAVGSRVSPDSCYPRPRTDWQYCVGWWRPEPNVNGSMGVKITARVIDGLEFTGRDVIEIRHHEGLL